MDAIDALNEELIRLHSMAITGESQLEDVLGKIKDIHKVLEKSIEAPPIRVLNDELVRLHEAYRQVLREGTDQDVLSGDLERWINDLEKKVIEIAFVA